MEFLLSVATLKELLPLLAILSGVFVISTKNAIISVFNLIVLYILVAFYLIYIGITYIGISYIIIYIGAIAILFLFIIMMIDIEVVEKRSNNYLPLLLLLLSGFLLTFKNILFNLGWIKIRSVIDKEENIFFNHTYENLFSSNKLNYYSNIIINDNNIFNNNYINDNFFNGKSFCNENYLINNLLSNNYNEEVFNLNFNKELGDIQLVDSNFYNNIINLENNIIEHNNNLINNLLILENYSLEKASNYLLISPNWSSAINRITQITAIGDILYSVYHSYIYILSIILLLGMVGAIILTADNNNKENKIFNKLNYKKSYIMSDYFVLTILSYYVKLYLYKYKFYFYKEFINEKRSILQLSFNLLNNFLYFNNTKNNIINKKVIIPSFFNSYYIDNLHSEDILGNLMYFIIANFIIAILLLVINYYFSLSVKYLEKGGGFECGFTSFVQTRERFNVIFYRVSLLFLIFDLEIILIFPYTTVNLKNQNISKNNVLAFLYILVIGFIYELKEGAINIVKKAHNKENNK